VDRLTFGDRLALARAHMKMTRQQLADEANISLSSLAAYERGENNPPIDVATRLSDILKISLDWLVGKESEKRNKPLETWSDAILMVAILAGDLNYTKFENSHDNFFRKVTITILNFPEEAGITIENMLPLLKKGILTRDQFLMLINDVAKKSNYPINTEVDQDNP
jgi:Predicted transcription factor, homolog of eukaryotic MBF1